ncbi:MAG: glycosyltransferase family 4 protein [Chloroflexi bacterium]|nr:glycosyltransferase family 4 protein [Chloroflexota bacterium]
MIRDSYPITAYDVGAVKSDPTGVGVYVRDLGFALAGQRGQAIRFIGARPDGPMADRAATLMRSRLHQLWVQTQANADARKVDADLVHYTNAVAPLRSTLPFVLTVQDLSLLRYPHYHPPPRLAAVPVMLAAIHRARRVLVPSRATADELMKFMRLQARRISIIELAPAATSLHADQMPASLLDRWAVEPGGYVLSVATLEPRKNLRRLISAFERFSPRHPHLRLVLMGGKGWRTRTIDEALGVSPVRNRIVTTGYVTDDERQALLQHCAVFAYVSLYEGYGLPIVEAMAAGAPVVTSNASSMPEAAGGAAVLVDPRRVAAIVAGLQEAWQNRDQLIEAGRRRVSVLTWGRVAHETGTVYDEVVARNGRD